MDWNIDEQPVGDASLVEGGARPSATEIFRVHCWKADGGLPFQFAVSIWFT